MSQKLIQARKRLKGVKSHLKMGKQLPAAQDMRQGLTLMLQSSLMKAEKDEFVQILTDVVHALNADTELRKHYPLVIEYTPGKEKELLMAMADLVKALEANVAEGAQINLEDMTKRKTEGLDKGQNHIEKEEWDEAHSVFDKLIKDFQADTNLKAEVADRFLKASRYEDAFKYLEDALRHDPNAIFLYNRIGIVLRKMKDFGTAERYYLKALDISKKDEYLFFNLGRLYYDWKKWDRMQMAAEKALEINPGFTEAEKMKAFAEKKMG